MGCNDARQEWQFWQCEQRIIYNLRSLLSGVSFESHPHRQNRITPLRPSALASAGPGLPQAGPRGNVILSKMLGIRVIVLSVLSAAALAAGSVWTPSIPNIL